MLRSLSNNEIFERADLTTCSDVESLGQIRGSHACCDIVGIATKRLVPHNARQKYLRSAINEGNCHIQNELA